MKRIYLAIVLYTVIFFSSTLYANPQKQIVGAVEFVHILGKNTSNVELHFQARVDTGAKYTSIHAENIKVDTSFANEDRAISFCLVNKQGQSCKINTHVESTVSIRTSEGSERRYRVPLVIKWNNSKKTVLVTLNNRERMKYGLLLGRNWLRGDFIVDIDRNNKD